MAPDDGPLLKRWKVVLALALVILVSGCVSTTDAELRAELAALCRDSAAVYRDAPRPVEPDQVGAVEEQLRQDAAEIRRSLDELDSDDPEIAADLDRLRDAAFVLAVTPRDVASAIVFEPIGAYTTLQTIAEDAAAQIDAASDRLMVEDCRAESWGADLVAASLEAAAPVLANLDPTGDPTTDLFAACARVVTTLGGPPSQLDGAALQLRIDDVAAALAAVEPLIAGPGDAVPRLGEAYAHAVRQAEQAIVARSLRDAEASTLEVRQLGQALRDLNRIVAGLGASCFF